MSDPTPVPVDIDSLTDEQIFALANAPVAAPPTDAPVAQPRDESGRFAPTPAPTEDPAEDLDPNEVVHQGELVYRLEIPGEDGSGSEVFYGHGPDFGTRFRDAANQLAQAKAHANRKIREQNKQLKERETSSSPKPTADEQYVLAQRLMTEPHTVIEEILTKRLNEDPRIKAAEQVTQEKKFAAVTAQWTSANPEYFGNEVNGNRMMREMQRNGISGVPTLSDIDAAYQSLKADGLLQVRPAPVADPAPIVAAPPAPPARRSSGLSTRASAVAPPAPTAPSQDELYAMPLEKLAELANRQARGL